ncbi:DUF4097 family beta strand repeat-containing protein [Micromonospora sp. NPDC003197]
MPTFDTPQPISVTLSLSMVVANVQVIASDRVDTNVDVQPIDPTSKADLKVAEQTRVEYANGRLTIKAPKLGSLFTRTGGIDVTLELPSGSQIEGETGMGDLRCAGRLAECQLKNGYGKIRIDQAGAVKLHSGSGDVIVEHIAGNAEVTNSNGAIRLGRIDGPATVKNSNGDSWIGEVAGELRLRSANGGITVDRAHANVTATTANGSVRLGEVVRGTVTLESAAGSLEVGVRNGTAAWLDLKTIAGRVRNELESSTGPGDAGDTVEIRARTSVGSITVRRS